MAFQQNAFQSGAFQIGFTPITDTDILQLPVDAVLAGQQPIKDRFREFDIRPMNMKTKTRVRAGGGGRLSGDAPSFTVTTSKRGHD